MQLPDSPRRYSSTSTLSDQSFPPPLYAPDVPNIPQPLPASSEAQDELFKWREEVEDAFLSSLPYEEELTITAPTEKEGALTFLALLKSCLSQTVLPNIASTISFRNVNLEALFASRLHLIV